MWIGGLGACCFVGLIPFRGDERQNDRDNGRHLRSWGGLELPCLLLGDFLRGGVQGLSPCQGSSG